MLSSCGFYTNIKRDKYIGSKGFDPKKDTSIILPYRYYIKHKGHSPIYRELNPTKKLDSKINIKNFENSDSIPFEKLFENMSFVLEDTLLTIEYGELYFSRPGFSSILSFGKKLPNSCMCEASFSHLKKNQRKINTSDILFFWNVSVIKDGVTYAIPSRMYNIK